MVPPPKTFAVTPEHAALLDPAVVLSLSSPDRAYHPGDLGPVFHHTAGDRDAVAFPDGKMLADSYPRRPVEEIGAAFIIASQAEGFEPQAFWRDNFELPEYYPLEVAGNEGPAELNRYISDMWGHLTYHQTQDRGSVLGTPYPHLKSGERFTEGYYWDLKDGVSGLLAEAATDAPAERKRKEDLVTGVAGNIVYQIESYGYVPNGLRTYYLGRSQPPVFAGIVKEMGDYFGDRKPGLIENYLPALTKEYEWWMRGEQDVAASKDPAAHQRVVRLPDGAVLNRHWDESNAPRTESYKEDIDTGSLAEVEGTDPQTVFRNLRAGAESGKDHTARFMADQDRLETIHTTDFIPIELNSMLWEYEDMIATAHDKAGNSRLAEEFRIRADRRQAAMNTYLWNESDGCYYDFDFRNDRQSDIKSMGIAYPVARGIATPEQGLRVATVLEQDLLKRGGFVSAAVESGQQWDAPNGFARDQIEGVNALRAVDDPRTAALATIAAQRWLRRDEEIFSTLGVLVEKSNVVSKEALPGSGGEYPVQRGFLWTNGVHRVFQRMLETPA